MISKARLKKLHRALRVRRQCRKATNDVLQYLRGCDRLEPVLRDLASLEPAQTDLSDEDQRMAWKILKEQAKSRGIPLVGDEQQFALDFGFGSVQDLLVALQKYY
jgi:hypothetical protein